MSLVPKKQQQRKEEKARKKAKKILNVVKKDVSKLREEVQLLENKKKENSLLTEEEARDITPYMCKEAPTLFKIIFTESEKNYLEIAEAMLDNLEKLNSGEINADKATEHLGKYLFEKLVKPNLPEEL